MKPFKLGFFYFLIASLTLGCKKERNVNKINSKIPLEATFLNGFGACFNTPSDSEYIINNLLSYQKLKNSCRNNYFTGCDTASLPSIDFTNDVLLGKKTGYGQGDKIEKQVIADTLLKKYMYTINITHCTGICPQGYIVNMNWVLVPKLPQNYKIQFQVINQ